MFSSGIDGSHAGGSYSVSDGIPKGRGVFIVERSIDRADDLPSGTAEAVALHILVVVAHNDGQRCFAQLFRKGTAYNVQTFDVRLRAGGGASVFVSGSRPCFDHRGVHEGQFGIVHGRAGGRAQRIDRRIVINKHIASIAGGKSVTCIDHVFGAVLISDGDRSRGGFQTVFGKIRRILFYQTGSRNVCVGADNGGIFVGQLIEALQIFNGVHPFRLAEDGVTVGLILDLDRSNLVLILAEQLDSGRDVRGFRRGRAFVLSPALRQELEKQQDADQKN